VPQLPTGTVTFLFSDIEGSTHLWEQAPDLMALATERHDQILRSAAEASGGDVFKSAGDSFCAAFRVADQAVRAAAAAQGQFSAESWPEGPVVRVRMALHTGECIERDSDYFGPALKQVATLLTASNGGQVLISGETADLIGGWLPVGVALRSLGSHHGRGLERAEEVFQLDVDGVSSDLTPRRSEVGLFDVFVSYRRTDQAIVRQLVDSLKRRGLVVWFDETSIPDFGGITDSVRQGLAESKALLVFYSADYPQSSPCQWELTAAFLASSRLGDPRRRVLVVNPEPGLGHIEPVELRDALYLTIDGDGHGGVEQIADAVAVQVDRLHGELGAGILAPSLWLPTKPSAATRFVGRWREMWRIHSALHAPETATTQGAVGQGAVQVRGLGGIGKSLLAREYALRFEAR
jgi:class 3 adenylate cyclase